MVVEIQLFPVTDDLPKVWGSFGVRLSGLHISVERLPDDFGKAVQTIGLGQEIGGGIKEGVLLAIMSAGEDHFQVRAIDLQPLREPDSRDPTRHDKVGHDQVDLALIPLPNRYCLRPAPCLHDVVAVRLEKHPGREADAIFIFDQENCLLDAHPVFALFDGGVFHHAIEQSVSCSGVLQGNYAMEDADNPQRLRRFAFHRR